MAFSSRFSFWERKIKDENQPSSNSSESDGLSSRARSVPALDPGRGLFRAKSPPTASPPESVGRVQSPSPPKVRTPIKMPERFRSPEPQFRSPEPPREQNGTLDKSPVDSRAVGNVEPPGTGTNETDPTDDQGLTRKKVVKVVRRVVRKVLPPDEDEVTVPAQKPDEAPEAAKLPAKPLKAAPAAVSKAHMMSGFSFKHDVIKTEDRDDISRGLTNLMVRGRTRELRPRIRRDDRPQKVELEKTSEKKVEPEERKEKQVEDKITPKTQDSDDKPTSSGPPLNRVRSPAVAENTPNTSVGSAPTSSKPTHSRPISLPPVVGFIPAPKPSALSPPPGFIPAPRLSAAPKHTTKAPPTGPPAQKPPSLSPPSRLVPAQKLCPVTPDPPRPLHAGPDPPPPSPHRS
ncbi:uncharacterized protein [Embiotoca jacksoni]|uniref:uncharacterized protein n=1 Tax=Embiotoca jacksoni TaxID=100190 RepID=UPI003704C34D